MIDLFTPVGENRIAPPPCVGFDSIVSPVLAVSVFLAHVISFRLRNVAYPLTDSPYYQQLLQMKMRRVASGNEDVLLKTKLTPRMTQAISGVGMELLDLELPQVALRSFEDTLHTRQKHKEQLTRFR